MERKDALAQLKRFQTQNLKINIEVVLDHNNGHYLEIETLSRISSKKEDNHTIAVAIFLKIFELNLKSIRFKNAKELYDNLEQNFNGESEARQHVISKLSENRSFCEFELRCLIEDFIIPHFYTIWYNREQAKYEKKNGYSIWNRRVNSKRSSKYATRSMGYGSTNQL